jgi:hypothetical protein
MLFMDASFSAGNEFMAIASFISPQFVTDRLTKLA